MEGRSFGLDVLRTVSVWMVMLSHAAYWCDPAEGGFYYVVIKPLLLGVEPFFVLGGFLAAISFQSVIIKNNGAVYTSDGRAYVKRRWLRTFPNYFLFLLIYAAAFYAVKPDFEFDITYLFFAQNFYWLSPSFFSISWSLATQEWFYLLLPFLMVVVGQNVPGLKKINPLFTAASGLIILSFCCRYLYLEQNSVSDLEGALRRIALLRLDSVGIGVLFGYFYFSKKEFFKRSAITLFLLGCVLVALLSFLRRNADFNSLYWVQMFFYPVFSLSMALWMPFFYNIQRGTLPVVTPLFENTSKWSYSIYLSHVLFLDVIYILGKKVGIVFEASWQIFSLIGLWVLITYVASALIYRYFEKPWLKYGK
jgi:peptidoglycan/LPS O-acetylase OafA/YrhL